MIPRQRVSYTFNDLVVSFFKPWRKSYKQLLVTELQNYFNIKYILLTPSGRGSLFYILKNHPYKDVYVSSYTCKAVAEAAVLAGKKIHFIDIETDQLHFSADALGKVIKHNCIVIATHQFGIPCEIEKISTICKTNKAFLIEDCAASLGTKIKGKFTGTFGDCAFLSFDSTKLLHTPLKGGAIFFKDKRFFDIISADYVKTVHPMPINIQIKNFILGIILLILKNSYIFSWFFYFFLKKKYTSESPYLQIQLSEYYTYDMTEWQAYIIFVQMKKLDKIIKKLQRLYSKYQLKLKNLKSFQLPPLDEFSTWACVKFPIRIHKDKELFFKKMIDQGVDCAFSFTYLPKQQQLKNSVKVADAILDIPFYYYLSPAEADYIIKVLKNIDDL